MKKFIGIFCLLALAGCEATSFPKNYTKATELCAENKGVKKINAGPVYFDVFCNNGATFLDIDKYKGK